MTDAHWIAIGFMGQALFAASILYQWLASERVQASIAPAGYWWLRISGAMTLFAYAWLYLGDWVFMLGTLLPMAPYVRNLWLIKKASMS